MFIYRISMSQIVLYFWHSTLVHSIYIDVILTLLIQKISPKTKSFWTNKDIWNSLNLSSILNKLNKCRQLIQNANIHWHVTPTTEYPRFVVNNFVFHCISLQSSVWMDITAWALTRAAAHLVHSAPTGLEWWTCLNACHVVIPSSTQLWDSTVQI